MIMDSIAIVVDTSLRPTATPSPNISASRAIELDVDQGEAESRDKFSNAYSPITSIISSDRGDNPQTQITPETQAGVLEPQGADRRNTALENLNIAGRFAQTLLKKLPDCVDTNPVKVALSVMKTIIDIKNVGVRFPCSTRYRYARVIDSLLNISLGNQRQ